MVSKESSGTGPFWVGIGASAGGLEALRGLVSQLDAGLNTTYIVAQHMSPHHKSLLTEIIGRETELPVLDVTDNLLPATGTIYITPPNTNVVVKEGRIHLQPFTNARAASKPSVDLFLTSHRTGRYPNQQGRANPQGLWQHRRLPGYFIERSYRYERDLSAP